jgi:glycosyltransferase involved in cell wall biosynthesis
MFSDYFFPELGGIQDSIAITARALGRRGHLVDIHAPRYGRRDHDIVGVRRAEPDLGPNVRIRRRASLPFPSSTRQSRAAMVSPLSWLGLRRAAPDVIHVHSFFGLGLEALLDGALLRLPVVGTNHTTVAGFGPHIPVSVTSAANYVLWFYNKCDHVTAPSRSVFDELGVAKLRPPCSIVSNPIDTALFAPAPEQRAALKARFGLTGPTIVYAGRLGPEKNIDILFRAVAGLARGGVAGSLAIAGHGSHEAALRSLATELGIESRVKFLGTLTQAELAALFQAGDVFTIMSTSETQSMALLQAMASGLPVVAANSRALPEFVTEGNGRLVNADDETALTSVLRDLLDTPEQRRALGAGGLRSAREYGVETVCDSWEAIYEAVLTKGTTR